MAGVTSRANALFKNMNYPHNAKQSCTGGNRRDVARNTDTAKQEMLALN